MKIERPSDRRLSKLAQAVEKESWGLTLIQLAWTAGPAAFIALQSGYLLGYHQTAPMGNIIYLAVYTSIAGLIGLLVRTFTTFIRGRKQKSLKKNLAFLMDQLPELIISTRDLNLSSHEPELRKRLGAIALLRSATATPEAIQLAVYDLCSDRDFANLVFKIEIYYRAGLNCLAKDIYHQNQSNIQKLISELRNSTPEAAHLLEQRLNGLLPTFKEGVPRKEGFISRILQAAESDNKNLMTLKDAEEMLTFLFELICGRKILILTFRYRGRKVLTEAADALEKARNNYGIATANFYSALHNLINFLVECGALENDQSQIGLEASQLLESSKNAIGSLCDSINKLEANQGIHKPYSMMIVLSAQVKILKKALELYQKIQRTFSHIDRRQFLLDRNVQKWKSISSRYSNATTALRSGRGQSGLRIIEQKIVLDEKEKWAIAKALAPHFNNFQLKPSKKEIGDLFSLTSKPITVNAIKELAIESALILTEFIPLSNPSVRNLVESANAIHFDRFRLELNSAMKTGWGSLLVNEVEKDLSKSAEQLARSLTQHYGIELTESAIDFLSHTYGVNRDTLEDLASHSQLCQEFPEDSPQRKISSVPPLNRYWMRTLERSKSLLRAW